MKLGQQALEALQAEITGKIYPGDDLVVAGETGISGTLELICREWDKLRTYFSESFLRMGVETLKNCMISEEDGFWKEAGFSALYFTENGGILSGLWKMAEASGVGMDVDLRRIPIRQETIEVCERLDVDPYKLEAKGSVLIASQWRNYHISGTSETTFDGNYTWKGQKRWQSLILYCWNLKFRQIQEI